MTAFELALREAERVWTEMPWPEKNETWDQRLALVELLNKFPKVEA